jgi:methionyl-tRNA formyltransferase
MRETATERAVPVLDPHDANAPSVRQQLEELGADLLVVCDYGQILSRETLAATPLGGINLHGSLLPKYRGAAPVQWALLSGESETGNSVIHMTPRLDAGPCLIQQRIEIGPTENAGELEQRMAEAGAHAVVDAIDILDKWDRVSTIGMIQENAEATRAPRLKKSDGEVDWNRQAIQIHNQVRALKPWPGTFTSWHREDAASVRLILDDVSACPEKKSQDSPGTVVAADSHEILVATGGGLLSVTGLQPAGKRAMSVADFLRGHHVSVGAKLGPA